MNSPSISRFCFHLVLAFMVLVSEAVAQVATDAKLDAQWSALRALSGGELVKVRPLKKGTVSGSIVSSTDSALTVATKGGQVTAARSDIKEVKVDRGPQLKKGLIGAAIGGGAGVATALILDGAVTDGNGPSGSLAALLGILGGFIGFALMGFRSGYKTIYKAH